MVKNLLTEQAELKDKLAAQEKELERVRVTGGPGKAEKAGGNSMTSKRVREVEGRNSNTRR